MHTLTCTFAAGSRWRDSMRKTAQSSRRTDANSGIAAITRLVRRSLVPNLSSHRSHPALLPGGADTASGDVTTHTSPSAAPWEPIGARDTADQGTSFGAVGASKAISAVP